MSAMTDAGRRGRELIERLTDALADPARRERTAAIVVLGYVALWTLYAAIAKGSQDIHIDMSEQFVFAQDLALGYAKHPPLAMWVVRAWFAVFPTTDWAYYLLAMVNVGLALWVTWRLTAYFLDGDKRVFGLALLTLVPFFNFHALKFNSNTILMPVWAATTLWFLRSFETRRTLDAALAGLGAAAAMYGKYWSVFLLLGLGTAALLDPRRAAYFRSPAPWVTIALGAVALAPHLAWLVAHDFLPFSYASQVHGDASFAAALRGALGYLAGSLAYVAVPLIIVMMAARPDRTTLRDMVWPESPERRLAAAAFWAVLLAPALLAPLAGFRLTSLWSMSAWTLLPVMLLASPLIHIGRRDTIRVVTLAVAFPLVMVAAAPAIAFALHRAGLPPGSALSAPLVAPLERVWRETTDRPFKAFAGLEEFTDGVAYYMPSHPRANHMFDTMKLGGIDPEIARDGIVLLCPLQPRDTDRRDWCIASANAIADRFPAAKRTEIEVARRYLGVEGKPARYFVVAIPPQR
jgi:4-amino-4-deoxy-L-arabinose transferase-like glycosyltransferase